MVAAAVAGYLGINAAALIAAIEFGVQPLLFTDATGAPLYAPYPLNVAMPAMMVAHLTIAGGAEAILSAGVVAYLQRANPGLLAPPARSEPPVAGWYATRWLWAGLGALMVLSPLGLLAGGVAWGEWASGDLPDAAAGASITAAVPHGLERLSSIWTAPIPDYAPPFMHSEVFGYVLSAVVGAGAILLLAAALSWLAGRRMPSGGSRA